MSALICQTVPIAIEAEAIAAVSRLVAERHAGVCVLVRVLIVGECGSLLELFDFKPVSLPVSLAAPASGPLVVGE